MESNLALGEQETRTFEAYAGDAVRFSMVGSGELPKLFGPDDTLLVSDDLRLTKK